MTREKRLLNEKKKFQRLQIENFGYNYDETLKIVKLYKEGISCRVIAEMFDTSRYSIRHQLKAYEFVYDSIRIGEKVK